MQGGWKDRVQIELLKSNAAAVGDLTVYVEATKDITRMPRFLAGEEVDVKVVGRLNFLRQMSVLGHKEKHRPLIGGISISTDELIGTLSFIDYNDMVVSCTQVIAMDRYGREINGMNVRQPEKGEVVGREIRHTHIEWNNYYANNLADVAIAKQWVGGRVGYVYNIGMFRGIIDAKVGDEVLKSGRTTGLTKHKVIDDSVIVKVYWNEFKWAIFRDCIMIEPAIANGDSGSPVVKGNKIVGIVFAGSGKVGILCKAVHCKIVNFGEQPMPPALEPSPIKAILMLAGLAGLAGGSMYARKGSI